LTSDTLQEVFQLDMSGSQYEAQDIWDVLIAAAVCQFTGYNAPVNNGKSAPVNNGKNVPVSKGKSMPR